MENRKFYLLEIIKQVPPPSLGTADNLSPKLSNYPQPRIDLHFWIGIIMTSIIKLENQTKYLG